MLSEEEFSKRKHLNEVENIDHCILMWSSNGIVIYNETRKFGPVMKSRICALLS